MQSSLPSTSAATAAASDEPDDDAGADGRRATRTVPAATKPSLLKTILRRLQDNRLEGGGGEEMARKLREINRVADDASYAVLKKVLNIIFVSTGFSLLFAVIFVIIYTAIVKNPRDDGNSDEQQQQQQQQQLSQFASVITLSPPSPLHPPSSDPNDPLGSNHQSLVIGHIHAPGDPGTVQSVIDYGPRGNDARRSHMTPPVTGSSLNSMTSLSQTITRCRVVPMVQNGPPRSVKLGRVCSEVLSLDGDSISEGAEFPVTELQGLVSSDTEERNT